MRRGRDDGELEEIFDAIDVEFLLDQEGVEYKVTHGSSGEQVNIKECPFCGNEKWKVYANAETGLGKCFVCEEGLTKWKMIAAHNPTLSNRDVVERAKSYARDSGWRTKRKTAVAVNADELKLPKSFPLPIKGRNVSYLENRRISADVAQYFSLRVSVDGKFRYTSPEGRALVQDYSKRIIIPIFDMAGELVSFQGRDMTGTGDKKYLFPPGYASTGAYLYNGQNAIGVESIVIGEGVFDVAAIKVAFDEVNDLRDVVPVGSFGKHLSHGSLDSQLGKLLFLRERGLKRVTFMWDGEKKAIRAAVDAALMVRQFGIDVRVAILPRDCDPNEVEPGVVRRAYYAAMPIDKSSATLLKLKYA